MYRSEWRMTMNLTYSRVLRPARICRMNGTMKAELVVILAAAALSTANAQELRELTNDEGKTIRAEVLDLVDGNVKIKSKGRVFEVPLDKLSGEDQAWLAEWDAKRKLTTEDLYYADLLFEDDFSGEGFGERWTHYKSGSLVQDGVMVGITPVGSDHQAVDTVKIESRRDMEVSMKFKFAGPEGKRFNLKFDDNSYKGAHAGHICRITVTRTNVSLSDDKTGIFANEIFEKKSAPGGLDEETKKLLETKSALFPLDLDNDDWHELRLRTREDKMTLEIDGERVGELVSEGVAHPTKSSVGLATPGKDAQYDDFVVKAAPVPGGGEEKEKE